MNPTSTPAGTMPAGAPIRTPDQRLRVFISSTLQELAPERAAVRAAVLRLRMTPVMFELGARAHPPRELYRAYEAQSDVFIGVYGRRYGWVAPGEEVSGIEDEWRLSTGMPRLVYLQVPAPDRDERLRDMLARIGDEDRVSYRTFATPAELQELVENDLALLLSEHFVAPPRPDAGRPGLDPGTGGGPGLPHPLTALVGRRREIERVVELVEGPGSCLVALVGPGGIGKSRIALEVAARVVDRFADGARFVDLATTRSPDLVAGTIAAQVGVRLPPGTPADEALVEQLAGSRMLLVLDNFEQVRSAAPLLTRLLTAGPGLRALVTSRAVLNLHGEHDVMVPALPVPVAGAGTDARSAARFAAVQLFVDRARQVAPGFELTDENAPAVAELCRRLDGIPLALELAAARIRVLTPAGLLDRLGDQLTTLGPGRPDAPDRQRTLRGAVAWSFDLLSPDEQELFSRLAVFSGGFDLAALEDLHRAAGLTPAGSGPGDGTVALEALAALVDSSLVHVRTDGGEARYGLFGSAQEFAAEQLRRSGHEARTAAWHARYFTTVAEIAAAASLTSHGLDWFTGLAREHDNLARAIDWSLDRGDLTTAGRISWAIWVYWWLSDHLDEGLHWFRRAEELSAGMSPAIRGRARTGTGLLLMARGRATEAREMLERGLAASKRAEDAATVAVASGALGYLAVVRGDDDTAGSLLATSLDLYTRLGDDWHSTFVLNFLAGIPARQQDRELTLRILDEALSLSRQVGGTLPLLMSLYNRAVVELPAGDLSRAHEMLEEGLREASAVADEPTAASYLTRLAEVAVLTGDDEGGRALAAAARARRGSAGPGWVETYTLDALGRRPALPRAPGAHVHAPDRRHLAVVVARERRRWAGLRLPTLGTPHGG